MSRLLSIFLLLLSVLAGCSSNDDTQKIGVDATWYPLSLDSREHNITAFSTELLTQIGRLEKIPFAKVNVNWNDLMEGLQNDQYVGILSSVPPRIFNEKIFDFSQVYLPLGPVLVVGIDSPITGIQQLDGKEIAVLSNSTSALLLEPSQGVLIRDYDSVPSALNAVIAQTVDGAVIDILPAASYCRDLYRAELKIVTPPLNDDGLRLITKHGIAPDLIEKFNAGLQKMQKEGSYTELLDKWSLQESVQ